MALKNTKEEAIFASVLADGRIHVEVPEGTEGAVIREYETSSGDTGRKCELVYSEISGMISKVAFYEGDYGKSLQLTIADGDEKPVVLSLGTASSYGEDMMKKLPNIDLEREVRIVPFSFTDDKGKNKKGMTVYQGDAKVANYFYDPETKSALHGFPEPKKAPKSKTLSKDEWKLYFMECRIFMIAKIEELFKLDAEEKTVLTIDDM